MDKNAPREPVLNLPPTVAILIGLNVAVHLIRQVIPDGWDDWLVGNFAMIPARYGAGDWTWPAFASLIGHQFLHANWLHLGVNMLMLAAFGSGMERRLGGRRMLALYFISGFAGAALQVALNPASEEAMVGASGAISGLLGGVLWLVHLTDRASGGRGRLAAMVVVTVVAMIVAGMAGMPDAPGLQIAWAAHIGGLLCGLALFPLLDRRG